VTYPRNLLNDNEEIVLDRNPHWSFLLGAAAMVLMAVAALAALTVVATDYAWVGVVIVLISLIGSSGRYLRWRTTEFVLTTDRLIVRQGILSKHGLEIPLDRVTNISFHQALWERMLGTGDLIVESAGESGHQSFTDVAGPSHVQNLIYRTAEEAETRRAAELGEARGEGYGLSIPEQIEKLAELHARAIISDEDFEAKKRLLLDRI
jgi:uncharacterized membrane protein YdbT with pleckstrin-like domain